MHRFRAEAIAAFAGILLVIWWCPKGEVQAQPRASTQTTYSHDALGLEKQFPPFLEAYSKGKTEEQDKAFAVFAIPAVSNWFAAHFSSTDVEQLGWDYESEVETYKKSLTTMMRIFRGAKRFHAHCKPADRTSPTSMQPRADAVKPTQEIPLEQFHIEFVSEDGRKFSELSNFVYEDGAYRYVGKGAYPFWSMPDATRK